MSEKNIWTKLNAVIRNDYGTAGLMGNLYAESALRSINLENTGEKKLHLTDEEYTDMVDRNAYPDFVTDRFGYGLAQWTYHTRKAKLLDYAHMSGVSIGDEDMQIQFLLKELLTDFPKVFDALRNAKSVRKASDAFLKQFEQPKDQSETVQVKRASYGQKYYDKYAGTQPDRERILALARSYVGVKEGSPEHHAIIDAYNAVKPLPRGYVVKYTDAWCATFISALSLSCGLTDIIPVECGCEEQIKLFQKLDEWVESDLHIPQPGDILYYDWQDSGSGDCTGHADHVGIVESCDGVYATIIEGNFSDQVKRRQIGVNARFIRGYAVPRYKDTAVYTPGWNHDSKGWWYATSESTYYHDTWQIINNRWYYFGSDGYILKGLQTIDNKKYYFQESGDFEGALCKTDDNGSLFPWWVSA